MFNIDKKKIYWILTSEFIATFLFVFWIILPVAMGFGKNTNLSEGWNNFYSFVFSNYLTKALWTASFLALILYTFRSISSNVNPAVTLSQYFLGKHDGRKATLMILTQFLAAISAALVMYGLVNLPGVDYWNSSNTLASCIPKLEFNGLIANTLNYNVTLLNFADNTINDAQYLFGIVTIAIEVGLTFTLLISINGFNDIVDHKYKPLFIASTLVIILVIGYHTNNICFNPARITASALVSTSLGHGNALLFLPLYLLGEFGASFIFLSLRNRKGKNE